MPVQDSTKQLTSAKDGSNVEQAFQMAARLAISRIPDEPPYVVHLLSYKGC